MTHMIKITNNDSDKTLTTMGISLSAGEFAYVGNSNAHLRFDTDGKILAVAFPKQDGNYAEWTIGETGETTVRRIQIGNLARTGQFYTVADSQ